MCFFSQTWGSQTGEREGGLGPRLGKNSHIFPFFCCRRPLQHWVPKKLLHNIMMTQHALMALSLVYGKGFTWENIFLLLKVEHRSGWWQEWCLLRDPAAEFNWPLSVAHNLETSMMKRGIGIAMESFEGIFVCSEKLGDELLLVVWSRSSEWLLQYCS